MLRNANPRRRRHMYFVDDGAFSPTDLANLAMWFPFNTGITSSGGAVSQWADASGNGRHLKQATATNQPALQGDGTILFDGVDNTLKTDSVVLGVPTTFYVKFKAISWAASDTICDGSSSLSMGVRQIGSSPALVLDGNAANDITLSPELPLNTYGIMIGVVNGASSRFQLNQNAAVTGTYVGASDPDGFSLGSRGGAGVNASNIQVIEAIVYTAAHDATTRNLVAAYLATKGP